MAPDLADPAALRALMRDRGIRPQHRLGQNFLADRRTLERICEAVSLTPDDLVLEIGPGLGSLTELLAQRAGRVVAVELDRGLLAVLQDTVAARHANVELVHGDAARIDLAALLQERLAPGRRAKVAANLPYYITTPLVLRLLEEDLPISEAVVMVQQEVAERMVASPGSKVYGALSVAVQFHSEAAVVGRVGRGRFIPQPEVDSAIVRLRLRQQPVVDAPKKPFFAVVKAAFGQRRKTLLNAVGAGLGRRRDEVGAALAAAGIDPQRRGETLSLQEFANLTRHLFPDCT